MSNLQQMLDRYHDRSKVSTARRGALASYVRAKGPDAVELCVNALDDPEASVRKEALRLLGDMRNPAAVEPLIDRMEAADTEMQRRILATLGAIGDEGARAAIEPLAEAGDFFIRSAARRALRQLDQPAAAPPPVDMITVTPDATSPATELGEQSDENSQDGPATLDPTSFRQSSVHDIKVQKAVRDAEAAAREERVRQPDDAREVAKPAPAPAAPDVSLDVQLGPSRRLPTRPSPKQTRARPVEMLQPVRPDDDYEAHIARRAASRAASQRNRQTAIPIQLRPRPTKKKGSQGVVTAIVIVVFFVIVAFCGRFISVLIK